MTAGFRKAVRSFANAVVTVSPWLFGFAALGMPFVLLETVAGNDVAAWSGVYVAGAVGGLVLELLRGRWRLELPSRRRGVGRSPEPSFAPYGPLTDIGFLGRMTTGAVAAPAFLAIINALDASEQQAADMGAYLASVAVRPDTLAWGVLLGAVSPVVWGLAESLVKSRLAVANTRLEINNAQVKAVHAQLKTEQVKLKRAAEKVALVAASRAEGVDEGGATDEVVPEVSQALVECESTISEAIGALAATATIKANGDADAAPVTKSRERTETTAGADGSARNGN